MKMSIDAVINPIEIIVATALYELFYMSPSFWNDFKTQSLKIKSKFIYYKEQKKNSSTNYPQKIHIYDN